VTTMQLPDLFEIKGDDEGDAPTGAMIALRPRQDHIDRLAVKDGEKPELLHTTILFLGKATDYSYDTRGRIIDVMREVAQRFRQVTGNGFAVNVFNPQGEEPCIVLGVGGSELVDIRNAIVEALQGFDLLQVPEQHEPWVPHITLTYSDDFKQIQQLTDLTGEVVYDAIRVAFGGIVDDILFRPTASANDGYAGGNRYTAVPLELTKNFTTPRLPVFSGIVLDEKVIRRVRTAAGVRRFGQPMGSVIVGDGAKLSNVRTVDSEYEGYQKYEVRGKPVYVAREGSKYVAYDADDNVISSDAKEESLLRTLDSSAPKGKRAASKAVEEDDVPAGLKQVESEYDDYDKFIGQNKKPVYRWHDDGKFYDENDEEIDVSDYTGKKKPIVVDMTPARTSTVSDTARRKAERMIAEREAAGEKEKPATPMARRRRDKEAEEPRTTTDSGSPAPAYGNRPAGKEPSSLRSGLTNPDSAEDLDAILDKIGNGRISHSLVEQIRNIAKRQTDVRNRRKLMLYAQLLEEEKVFADLVKMDYKLRVHCMEYKLITPGGRVGSGASLSRSSRDNWVERTPMGRLPKYIRIVANGLKKAGHGTSRAIALAVAAMKRWARGGDNVRPQVQAAAAKALAQWEALKASA
jgi:2'-5' RNA ligase